MLGWDAKRAGFASAFFGRGSPADVTVLQRVKATLIYSIADKRFQKPTFINRQGVAKSASPGGSSVTQYR
jgi:hypothetical protein